ncbi:hypothetical protein [Halarchaeum nitratireducens]|uniref:Uncharacterized protein n=1 Tax=Halarchaeum nitratireducens TaxID=489913 RepID=A0A830GDR2_9EURY|nr:MULTISPECIES: hypothetical protein [Halarchaeum]MBP2252215.1 hypothetical protein [Halarchaeum solikamskense]GGN18289.1 hypothetical protein GCM10009021_18990 [Halarchaeum nitratireducens]
MSDTPSRVSIAVSLLGLACIVADAALDVAFPLGVAGSFLIPGGTFALAWWHWTTADRGYALIAAGSALCLLGSYASDLLDGRGEPFVAAALALFGLGCIAVGARTAYAEPGA